MANENHQGPVIGQVYYKLTVNGNLQGEFTNNHTRSADVEAPRRVCPKMAREAGIPVREENEHIFYNAFSPTRMPAANFIGVYRDVWTERMTPRDGWLKISAKEDCVNIYTLEWYDRSGEIAFAGEGMLCDNILIGHYVDIATWRSIRSDRPDVPTGLS